MTTASRATSTANIRITVPALGMVARNFSEFQFHLHLRGVLVSGRYILGEYIDPEDEEMVVPFIVEIDKTITIWTEKHDQVPVPFVVAVGRKFPLGPTAKAIHKGVPFTTIFNSEDFQREANRLTFAWKQATRDKLKEFAEAIKNWEDWKAAFLEGSTVGPKSTLTILPDFNPQNPRFYIKLTHPRDDREKGLVPEKIPFFIKDELVAVIQSAINWRRPIRLVGEPGTGKSTFPRYLASELGMRYVLISCSGNMDEFHLQGFQVLENGETRWVETEFVKAVREGGVIHFDEYAFLHPEAKAYLASLFDDRRVLQLTAFGGEIIEAHPDCIFIATQNPDNGRFGGQHESNEAWDDRFLTIHMDYLEPEMEVEMLMSRTPNANRQFVREVVNLANRVRELFRRNEIDNTWTPRAITDLIRLVTDGVPLDVALKLALYDRVARDSTQVRALRDLAETCITGAIRLAG